MQTIEVQNRQCFIDLAMQHMGNAEAGLQLALSNGRSITELLTAGTLFPTPPVIEPNVVELFRTQKAVPASVLPYGSPHSDEPPGEGIGFWYLENDFIIQ